MQVEAAPKDKSAAEAAAAAAREQQARAQVENQRRKDKAAERKQKANQKRKAHEAERKAQEAAAKAEVCNQCNQVASSCPPYNPIQSMLLSSKPVMTGCHATAFSLTHLVSCVQKQQQASAAMAVKSGGILRVTTVLACSPYHLSMYPNHLFMYKRDAIDMAHPLFDLN